MSGLHNVANATVAVVLGNMLTLFIIGILFMSYQLVASYIWVFVYGLLLAEALQRPKLYLIRILPQGLGHSVVASLMLLGITATLMGVVLALLVLGMYDMKEVLARSADMVKESAATLALNNTEYLEAWGLMDQVDSAMSTVQGGLVSMEAEYNSTEWWPMVADTVEALRRMEDHSGNALVLAGAGMANVTSFQYALNFSAISERAKTLAGSLSGDHLWREFQNRRAEMTRLGMQSLAPFIKAWTISVALLRSFASSLIQLIFFISLTLSFLASERSILHEFVGGLCGPDVEENLREILEGVFFFPILLCMGRFFYTLCVGLLLQLPFPVLIAVFTFLQSLIPIISAYPFLSCIPWVIYLVGFAVDSSTVVSGLSAAVLVFSQYYILGYVEEFAANAMFTHTSGWIIGLSVVCGFEAFGVQAFFIGPLVISLVSFTSTCVSNMVHVDEDSASSGSESGEEVVEEVREAQVPPAHGKLSTIGVALPADPPATEREASKSDTISRESTEGLRFRGSWTQLQPDGVTFTRNPRHRKTIARAFGEKVKESMSIASSAMSSTTTGNAFDASPRVSQGPHC
mmetsp:Transcript_883/g.2498  ORF Transcript_883/g.2498 Transcript_883/m.2498 type:complete len:575 (-) Transcript_883:120-1844(-)